MNKDHLVENGVLINKIRKAVYTMFPDAVIGKHVVPGEHYKSHKVQMMFKNNLYILRLLEHCQGYESHPRRFEIELFYKGKSIMCAGYLTSDDENYESKVVALVIDCLVTAKRDFGEELCG